MASVFHLFNDAFNVKRDIVRKYTEYAESDKKLYFSAVRIQSCWRGYSERKRLSNLTKNAIIIERYTRGWLVRSHLPSILRNHYIKIKIQFYNKQATLIQALWKGYTWRRDNFSIKKIMAEREELRLVTERMQQELEAFRKQPNKHGSGDSMDEDTRAASDYVNVLIDEVMRVLFTKHHLMRTKQHEGVLSIHGSEELSAVEKILQGISFKDYIKRRQEVLKNEKCAEDVLHDDRESSERKKFDLNTKLKPKPYERMLMTQE